MRLSCCLCGRHMDKAAVFIGTLAVGSKCARRANLLPSARRGLGLLRIDGAQSGRGKGVMRDLQTLDLFEHESNI